MIEKFGIAKTRKEKIIMLCLLLGIISVSFSFLLAKAKKINSWDNWSFGSAQTMLTARHWGEQGFIKNKLLFIPSGYHSKIEFLDQPEFRFLANGTKTGELIGTRLYYTHYPSGYLVPFGFLAKMGIHDRFFYRFLAIFLSTASIFFLFGFIYFVFNKNFWIAFISAIFYSASATYLGYADSLANMPIDDFLKYAILFLSLYSYKSPSPNIKNKFEYLIWSLFFILALSSYDSTFFVFFWLITLDFINAKKISLRYFLTLGSAPVFAFLLQIIQNTWYFGVKDMFLDFWGSFLFRSTQAPAAISNYPLFFKNIAASLSTIGYFLDARTRFMLPVILILIFLIYKFKLLKPTQWKYAGALAASGIIYPILMPIAGTFGYQGRQMAAFVLILISTVTYEILINFKNLWKKSAVGCLVLLLTIGSIWTFRAKGTYSYVKNWPNNTIDGDKINNWQEIKKNTEPEIIVVTTEKALSGSEIFFAEFYSDRLILSFKNLNDLYSYSVKINKTINQENFLAIITQEDRATFFDIIKNNDKIKIIKENLQTHGTTKNYHFYLSVN